MAPVSWLSDVNFSIKDNPAAPDSFAGTGGALGAAAAAPSQGFSLTRDEAENMVRQAEGVLHDIEAMQAKARNLTRATPPARDPASIAFNTQLIGNGQGGGAFGSGVEQLSREWEYLHELVQRLNKALGRTAETDDATTATINHAVDGGIAQ